MKSSTASKFVRIIATERSINALDESGDVWVYGGTSKGWIRLNMNREGEREASFKRDVQKANSSLPVSWEDDSPF